MRTIIFLLCALPAISLAQVPVTFESGTPALASEVNENFTNLDTRVNESIGAIIISGVTAADGSGVAGAICPADRLAISVQCDCNNENDTRNFGVLFACQAAGNGGVAGCFPEGATFNPALPMPLATIAVGCASALTNDGTPIDPTPIFFPASSKLSSDGTGINNSEALSDTDELDAALQSVRNTASDYLNKLQMGQ